MLTTVGRIIFNERIERALEETLAEEYDPATYEFVNRPLKKRDMADVIEDLVATHGPYASRSSWTRSRSSASTASPRPASRSRRTTWSCRRRRRRSSTSYEEEVAEIQDQYETGLITQTERHDAVSRQVDRRHRGGRRGHAGQPRPAQPHLHDGQLGARGSFKQIRSSPGCAA